MQAKPNYMEAVNNNSPAQIVFNFFLTWTGF